MTQRTRPRTNARRLTVLLAVLASSLAGAVLGPLTAAHGAPTPSQPAPNVVPALRQWTGGTGWFALSGSTRIEVAGRDADTLRSTARTFAADLAAETGLTVPVVHGTAPEPGDVVLTLGAADPLLGSEGYRLAIGKQLVISAPAATGVFYATQTVEQILKADPHRTRVPRGTAVDWPEFGVRAQMLDVGRKYYPLSYLRSQIRTMAWEKLNTFNLHFTDWEGFRIQVPGFAGLASAQSYSAADLRALQDYGHRYHVMIIPEVDLPAHATAITTYDPQLRFSCHSLDYGNWTGGGNGGWTLDITKAYTKDFVHRLLSKIIPMFDAPYFHIGGDEYQYDADKAACPELVAYQQARGFQYPGDVFTDFMNTLDAQVRSYGKTAEMWEWWDFNGQQTSVKPNKDIVIDAWVGSPTELAAEGYQVVGTPEDTLYVSAGFGTSPGQYGYVDLRNVYENYGFDHPANVLGYRVSRWSDQAENQTPQWLDFFAKRPLQILADRLWGGPRAPDVWSFLGRADQVGDAPSIDQLTAVPKAQVHVASVDSQETTAEDGAAADAVDNDPYTIWHSAYTGTVAPMPHQITLDLGDRERLGGLRYLPRQDGGANGRIAGYEIWTSANGRQFRERAAGTFADNQTEKEVDFPAVRARYVRLVATSSTNGLPYAAAAEVTPLESPTV